MCDFKGMNVISLTALKTTVLALLFLLAPAVFFYIRNSAEYSFSDLSPAFLFSFLLVVVALLVVAPLAALKNKQVFAFVLLGGAYLWYIQFYFEALNALIAIPGQVRLSYLITSLLVVFAAASLAYYSRKAIVRKGVAAFLLLNLFSLVTVAVLDRTSTPASINTSVAPGQEETLPLSRSYEQHKTVNIYYVIMDGMASGSSLQNLFKLDPTAKLDELRTLGFDIVSRSYSSYNMTHLSLASIFHQDYFIDENSPRYVNRDENYPAILQRPAQLPLIQELSAMNYKFYHLGNQWAPCAPKTLIHCLELEAGSKNFYTNWLNSYTITAFFGGSAFAKILKRASFVDNSSNDGLRKVSEALVSSKKFFQNGSKFFFIHEMSPHPPFTDEQCQTLDNYNYTTWDPVGYRSSAQCALNRMVEFSELVSREDPHAIVVFQGDHGPMTLTKVSDDYTLAGLEERFSIFNAIKLPEQCRPWITPNAGNVETIKLVTGCLSGRAPMLEPRHFAGFYEGPNKGKVKRVRFEDSITAPQP